MSESQICEKCEKAKLDCRVCKMVPCDCFRHSKRPCEECDPEPHSVPKCKRCPILPCSCYAAFLTEDSDASEASTDLHGDSESESDTEIDTDTDLVDEQAAKKRKVAIFESDIKEPPFKLRSFEPFRVFHPRECECNICKNRRREPSMACLKEDMELLEKARAKLPHPAFCQCLVCIRDDLSILKDDA